MKKKELGGRKTILYVEDEQWFMSGVLDALEVEYVVLKARNADQALKLLTDEGKPIDLIVLDIMMPPSKQFPDQNRGRTSGVGLLKALREQGLTLPVVCYTVIDDYEVHLQLMELGVFRILLKRENLSKLTSVIKEALNHDNSKN